MLARGVLACDQIASVVTSAARSSRTFAALAIVKTLQIALLAAFFLAMICAPRTIHLHFIKESR
jgi:hypothetical protein